MNGWKRDLKVQASILGAAVVLLVLARTYGPRCLQGPYLQSPTTNSIVIRWRTTSVRPIDCTLRFGTERNQLAQEIRSGVPGDTHEVVLTNLTPGTRYYYTIHSPYRRIAGGERVYFQTLPMLGQKQPVRAWVLGDSGTGKEQTRAVLQGFHKFSTGKRPDLMLLLGDNAYERGSRPDHHRGLFLPFREHLWSASLWPALGNHDLLSRGKIPGTHPFHDFFTLPQAGQCGGVPSGRENYYSFDYANIHFVCLDSTDLTFSNHTAMVAWLAKDLEASKAQDWLIAYWHHPPYSYGHHDSDTEAESKQIRALALLYLERSGADLVLCGHTHTYGRTHLLRDHYGEASTFKAELHQAGPAPSEKPPIYKKPRGRGPNQGTVYVVAGCAGKLDERPVDHPAMAVKLNVAGSVVVDVDGMALDFTFVDQTGVARDRFRMVKE